MPINQVNTDDITSIQKDLRRFFRRVSDTRPLMGAIALRLDKEAKKSLLGQRSGILYKKVRVRRVSDPKYPRRRRDHRASAEGEAPRSDSGDLRSSVQFEYNDEQAVVGSRLKYSAILEAKDGLNRPWLAKVQKTTRPDIQRIIQRQLKRATQ